MKARLPRGIRNDLLHRADVVDREVMVERINLRAQRRRHRLRRRAGADHYSERRRAEMTVRKIDHRLRLSLKTLATHIADHTDDCAERVVAEAETFTDG